MMIRPLDGDTAAWDAFVAGADGKGGAVRIYPFRDSGASEAAAIAAIS